MTTRLDDVRAALADLEANRFKMDMGGDHNGGVIIAIWSTGMIEGCALAFPFPEVHEKGLHHLYQRYREHLEAMLTE